MIIGIIRVFNETLLNTF